MPSKRSSKNSNRAGPTRARYRASEQRSTDMNEDDAATDMNEDDAADASEKEANRRAAKAQKEAEERAQRVEEVITKAKEEAYKKEQEQRAKVREAQKTLSTDDEHLEKVISLLDDLESKEVLSYRVELPTGAKAGVVWIALKNGPPTMITIEPGKVRVEKVGTDGGKVTVRELDALTEADMAILIKDLASDWRDPETLSGLWDVFENET
jgi:flagellar biosynthesis GTPase FlhF